MRDTVRQFALKERMKKRQDRFVVGYLTPGNCVYSRKSAKPFTLRQARIFAAGMPSDRCAIFELVPVEINR